MSITVKQFIEDYLIKEIGEIKDRHPYFAFLLMAIGIEFLGKCRNASLEWNQTGRAKKDFNLGIKLFPQKYKTLDLYNKLRCGMAHSFAPQNGLQISNGSCRDSAFISCDDFYKDFTYACNKIVSEEIKMPNKKLNDTFLFVQDFGEISVSGSTINNVSKRK